MVDIECHIFIVECLDCVFPKEVPCTFSQYQNVQALISIEMFPEDGCLWVHDIDDREVVAFTEDGIECLKQIIADQRDIAAESKSDQEA